MSSIPDMSSETGIPALEDEIASSLIGSKSLSYVQPTLVDRVKDFFTTKVPVDHAEPSPSPGGNDGKTK